MEKINEKLKEWIWVHFELQNDKLIFGLIFKLEEDAIKGMIELQEFKNPTLHIVENEDDTLSFLFVDENEEIGEGRILRNKKGIKNHKTFKMFVDKLSQGSDVFATTYFQNGNQILTKYIDGQISLRPLKKCAIHQSKDFIILPLPQNNNNTLLN